MAGTIKHRHQTAIANDPTKDVSADEWNDSEVIGGGSDGQLCEKLVSEADGWRLTGTPGSGGGVTQYSVDGGNGARAHLKAISEEITLDTGATFKDSTLNLLQANSFTRGVVFRLTAGITTAVNWKAGDANVADRFLSETTDVALNTTKVGLNHLKGNVIAENAGPTQIAAAKLRITTDVNPGAGKVRVVVYYEEFVPPTA